MSVSDLTQRLLAQGEKQSFGLEVRGPRFHDFLKIYQIQNMALDRSRKVRRCIEGTSRTSERVSLNMPSTPFQHSASPQEILKNMNRCAESDQGPADNVPVIFPSILLSSAYTKSTTEPSSLTATPNLLPPIHSFGLRQPLSLPWIKSVYPILQSEVVMHSLWENRMRQSELGKRPRSSLDAATERVSTLLMAAADMEGSRRARMRF
jgi:hypothetical protein